MNINPLNLHIMLFTVEKATLETVNKPGSKNHGRKYLKLELKEKNVFWRPQTASTLEFLEEEQLPQVEKIIAEGGKFPDYAGTFIPVKTPGYRVRNEDKPGEYWPKVHHEMRLFVGLNRDNLPYESIVSLETRAARIIEQSDLFQLAEDEATPVAPAVPI